MKRILLALCLAPALAAEPQVKARLLAEQTAVVAGGKVRLGVLLEPSAHWHTYWKNAGDAGLPSEFEWKLPAGFSAGPMLWPLPGRYQVGGLVVYGYDRAALHTVEVSVPETLSAGQPVHLGVHVSWLACNEETCVPGEADLSISLPVAEQAGPSPDRARFEEVEAAGEADISVSRHGRELLLRTAFHATAGYFFPDPGLQIVDAAPQVVAGPPFSLRLQEAHRPTAIARLQGLLVVGEGNSRKGYRVDVPVR